MTVTVSQALGAIGTKYKTNALAQQVLSQLTLAADTKNVFHAQGAQRTLRQQIRSVIDSLMDEGALSPYTILAGIPLTAGDAGALGTVNTASVASASGTY